MNTRTSAVGLSGRLALAFVVLLAFATQLSAQDLVIQSGASFTGSGGTYNIKGNISNSGVAASTSIPGTINIDGTSAQSIGTATNGALSFGSLAASGGTIKSLNVNLSVSDALSVSGASTVFDIGTSKLTLGGTISLLSGGAVDFAEPASEVEYAKTSGTQTVLGTSYGKLTLSGAASFNLSDDAVAAGAVSHTGGALSVNHNFTAQAGYTFGTLTEIAANKTLTLGTTGSIATISAIGSGGQLVNGSGLLTVGTLSGNSGTITAAANGGGMTFTNAATNSGTITGGAGAVTFSNTLAHNAGTITAGSGGVVFGGVPTIALGATITAGSGASLDFNADVANGGTISLTGTGSATFAGNFSSVGTISFSNTSSVTYDGADQDIVGTSYGNLSMTNSGTKTALGSLTVNGAFDNGGAANAAVTTDMGTHDLTLNGSRDNTNATIKFGGNNGRIFTTGTVEYNASSGTQVVEGHATDKYANLIFSGGGTKQIGAGVRVATAGSLTVGSGVTADVSDATSLLIVEGNLVVAGTLSNNGTVTVGL